MHDKNLITQLNNMDQSYDSTNNILKTLQGMLTRKTLDPSFKVYIACDDIGIDDIEVDNRGLQGLIQAQKVILENTSNDINHVLEDYAYQTFFDKNNVKEGMKNSDNRNF